jgi:superfamily II DNA or RNA helicase
MYTRAAISNLKFPLELKKDQLDTVDAWLSNGFRGSIIYSVGTGKTEIAFECAKKAANATAKCFSSYFNILYLVPRIVLVNHNLERLLNYGIPEEHIGVYFGERKQIQEITISTYNSVINNLYLGTNCCYRQKRFYIQYYHDYIAASEKIYNKRCCR